MDIGLLWYDNSKNSVTDKVQQAAAHYEKKFGQSANYCMIHPSMLAEKEADLHLEQIAIECNNAVLPHHYWIGQASIS